MKTIVITGASSGFGEAAARRLAREPDTRLLLVARRADRLDALAGALPAEAEPLAVDLLDDDAPARIAERVAASGPGLSGLVNNAGASFRGRFADTGYATVKRELALNFEAPVRLCEALLPALRAGAPSGIANVSSTAARVSRPGTGGYSASKAAFSAWTDSLAAEEAAHGVHVGLVLPGFVVTEGFPQTALARRWATRWMLGDVDDVAEAIAQVVLGRSIERYTPRPYALAAGLRLLAPRLMRSVQSGAGGRLLSMPTRSDRDDG